MGKENYIDKLIKEYPSKTRQQIEKDMLVVIKDHPSYNAEKRYEELRNRYQLGY